MIGEKESMNFFNDLRQKLGPIRLILQSIDHGELIRTFDLVQEYEMRLDQIVEVTKPLACELFTPSSISLNN